jgi:ABC-2 type transport system permease protein
LWRLVDVPIGLGLIVYALIQLEVTPSTVQITAFVVALLSAILILYSIWVMLMSLAFWFVAVDNLSVLFDAAFETARYPVAAFPRGARVVLLTLVPLAWTTTIPAATLTGRLDWANAGGAIGVAASLFLLSRVMWTAGLRRYTGAGG